MNNKIAIASTDGKVVNEHFGRAQHFHIFEIGKGGYRHLESRTVSACCHSQGHNHEAFDKVAKALRDCRAIIVAKIGEGASTYLESKGFLVFEAPYLIDGVMKKIIEDNLLEGGA
ncbi:hypothetical protein Ami103574_00980 [Aminipila butyrica]|uniref:Dinitrogenase iron-molybdenum cofactor biosynthesis domain-containing protein n=1 Tax=Aminipila butyrica TaxID=433296 RepID=A0A858BR23_9FIRM|nr:NifB/NifX family molybdenum-iron cluster-binding protein [Aminipila butyrica]QIB67967.1 hypothetical protein Ami103574_00980 [Aminipila butyrica]